MSWIRSASRFVANNPFVVFGLASLGLAVFSAMPEGLDYDPDPLRSALRPVALPLALPFFLAGVIFESFPRFPARIGVPLMYLLGILPYVLADVALRFWRRRRTSTESIK